MKKLTAALAAVATALGLAGVAEAHVTLHPNALPSGGYTVLDVRVPNERAKARTTKVDLYFPHGFPSVSYQPKPGWKAKVVYRKLRKPITVSGKKITQEVGQVIWTGSLPPGQFTEFPLSIAVPKEKAGTVLTFKALQTYSNGEVVRWIGPPGADTPAPRVVVTPADSAAADYPGGVKAVKHALATRRLQSASPALGALVAIPLLGLGGVALVRRRRRSA